MRVYAAELICSLGVSGFQTFKPVFCIYNKLRLHAEMLSSLVSKWGHFLQIQPCDALPVSFERK